MQSVQRSCKISTARTETVTNRGGELGAQKRYSEERNDHETIKREEITGGNHGGATASRETAN